MGKVLERLGFAALHAEKSTLKLSPEDYLSVEYSLRYTRKAMASSMLGVGAGVTGHSPSGEAQVGEARNILS